jgi:AcrR family transcriptional regulator
VGNVIPITTTLARRSVESRREAYSGEIRALLDAALAVMRREGAAEPRVSDVVRESGLSNQAFYRHFHGKAELMAALLEDGRHRMVATIERRMSRADDDAGRVRAWVEAVMAQATDPDAAANSRPFAVNGNRLADEHPDEARRARDVLLAPLRAIVDPTAATAIYHVAMGTMQDALLERRVPTRTEIRRTSEFAVRGAGLEAPGGA